MDTFSPELAEHWRASQASTADDRSEAGPTIRCRRPNRKPGGAGRARQRRAQRLLTYPTSRICVEATLDATRVAFDTRSPLPAIFLPAGFFLCFSARRAFASGARAPCAQTAIGALIAGWHW